MACPSCKRSRSLKRLPVNFKCADLICDFCGYLCQVKAANVVDIDKVPDRVLGAAWSVQKERMESGVYFPLFLVLVNKQKETAIYYLAAELQERSMFVPRAPLNSTARRAGWQGFLYHFGPWKDRLIRLR